MNNEFWYIFAQIIQLQIERAKLRIIICRVPDKDWGRIWYKTTDEEVFSTEELAIRNELAIIFKEICDYIPLWRLERNKNG